MSNFEMDSETSIDPVLVAYHYLRNADRSVARQSELIDAARLLAGWANGWLADEVMIGHSVGMSHTAISLHSGLSMQEVLGVVVRGMTS